MKDARSVISCSGESQVYESRRKRDKSGADYRQSKTAPGPTNRKIFVQLMSVAAVLALAGCKIVSDPPRGVVVQDVEFLRGCWVEKTAPGGEVTGFLRLLPEGVEGLSYQGYVQKIDNGQQTTPIHLSFARDGSSMTIRSATGRPVTPDDRGGLARPHAKLPDAVAGKLPAAAHRVSYAERRAEPPASWLIAEGNGETLAVYVLEGNGEANDVFGGERDGCD